MVVARFTVVLASVLALAGYTFAFGTGAPESACENLTPNHQVDAQQTPPPFQITTSVTTVTPGTPVQVTLSANSGVYFKGFFIRCRQSGVFSTGTFQDSSFGSLRCNNQGMTHKMNDPKNSITITWIPPVNLGTSPVQFEATFVQERQQFWTGVKSAELAVGGGSATGSSGMPEVATTSSVSNGTGSQSGGSFNQPASTSSPFGQNNDFGQSTFGQSNGVGQTSSPTFGQNNGAGQSVSPGFGQNIGTSQPVSPTFGQNSGTGQSVSPTFGQNSGTGQSVSPAFGQNSGADQSVSPGFGQNSVSPGFGQNSGTGQSVSPGFGQNSGADQSMSPGFGQNNGAGQSLSPNFGQNDNTGQNLPTTNPFGQNSGFDQTGSTASPFGQTNGIGQESVTTPFGSNGGTGQVDPMAPFGQNNGAGQTQTPASTFGQSNGFDQTVSTMSTSEQNDATTPVVMTAQENATTAIISSRPENMAEMGNSGNSFQTSTEWTLVVLATISLVICRY